jgi:predicted O-methyltransferase YrrM
MTTRTSPPAFDDLWKDLQERSRRLAIPIVQDYNELEHVYNLIQGCESYLEIGTAEGNSLYVLSQAVKPWSKITYVDLGEKHTTPARDEVLDKLASLGITRPHGIHADSNDPNTLAEITDKYDVVLIDAGHSYKNAITDARFYAPLAKKYVIFHDICLPEVKMAYNEYCNIVCHLKHYEVINSKTMGFGIIEVV